MGCEVTVLSTSESKRTEAVKTLGADHFVVSRDEAAMKVRLHASVQQYGAKQIFFDITTCNPPSLS